MSRIPHSDPFPTARAAGGLVVRDGSGGPEVAVVHRPRYGDWSLPKGKLGDGESFETAALREVEEETGLRCELGEELEPARYTDRRGRAKLVRFWLMRPIDGEFAPNDEVDELRWLAPDAAVELLDYDHDRALVAGLGARAAGD
jgi:8-oxo-dGTP diphosphatase